MESYNLENQDNADQTFTAPYNGITQAPGTEGNAFLAYNRAKAQNEMAMENANNLERMNRIQQLEIEIPRLQEKIREVHEQRRAAEANFENAKKANQKKRDDIELKMAANRVKRGDGGDFYRWKKSKDANAEWQNEMNGVEQQIANIQTRNEYNESLNKALEIWQKSKGDAVAEAYAKQNVNGLLELGKAKFGVDFSGKIAEAEALDAENKKNEAASIQTQKETESTQYKNFLKLNEKKPATFKTPKDTSKWLATVRQAFENGEISIEQAEELRNIGESSQTKRKKKAEDASIEIGVDSQKAAAAAGKLTLDEFKSKLGKGEPLTREEVAALNKKKSEVLKKYETYKGLSGSRQKQFWNTWGSVFQQFNLQEVR